MLQNLLTHAPNMKIFFANFSSHIELYKKIDGHEASWALGAAFAMLQQ
jgi:hypothetical protein